MNKICIADSFETILDSTASPLDTTINLLTDENCAQSIPFISTIMSAYHIGKTIHERHHLAKLYEFIQEINKGVVDLQKREKYITTWHANRSKREAELEYLVVIIDRYLHKDAARMLARIYLAYLEVRITWNEVVKYSIVMDRLLPGDYETLKIGDKEDIDKDKADDAILRLVGLGLMVSYGTNDEAVVMEEVVVPHENNNNYSVTQFGKKLIEIIE